MKLFALTLSVVSVTVPLIGWLQPNSESATELKNAAEPKTVDEWNKTFVLPQQAIDDAQGVFFRMASACHDLLMDAWQRIRELARPMTSWFSRSAAAFVQRHPEAWQQLSELARSVTEWFNASAAYVTQAFVDLARAVTEWLSGSAASIVQRYPEAWQQLSEFARSVTQWLSRSAAYVTQAFVELARSVTEWLSGSAASFVQRHPEAWHQFRELVRSVTEWFSGSASSQEHQGHLDQKQSAIQQQRHTEAERLPEHGAAQQLRERLANQNPIAVAGFLAVASLAVLLEVYCSWYLAKRVLAALSCFLYRRSEAPSNVVESASEDVLRTQLDESSTRVVELEYRVADPVAAKEEFEHHVAEPEPLATHAMGGGA